MPIVKAVTPHKSLNNVINYVEKDTKTNQELMRGYYCDPETAIDDFNLIKDNFDKHGGREYKHYVVSFDHDDSKRLSNDEVLDYAQNLFKDINDFKDYQQLFVLHNDKEHTHVHVIVNSVSFEDGKKLQVRPGLLREMKDMSNNKAIEKGYNIPSKTHDFTSYDKENYRAIVKGADETIDYKSWKYELVYALEQIKEFARNPLDYISRAAEQGITVHWSDTRKNITYEDAEGNKVRDSKLERDFKYEYSKEKLQPIFEHNDELYKQAEQLEMNKLKNLANIQLEKQTEKVVLDRLINIEISKESIRNIINKTLDYGNMHNGENMYKFRDNLHELVRTYDNIKESNNTNDKEIKSMIEVGFDKLNVQMFFYNNWQGYNAIEELASINSKYERLHNDIDKAYEMIQDYEREMVKTQDISR